MNLLKNDDDDILSFIDLNTFEIDDHEIENDGNRDSPSFKLDLENLSSLHNGANKQQPRFACRCLLARLAFFPWVETRCARRYLQDFFKIFKI
uniref:Uncharacterized protein n=1 Tax=Strongyloides venezuelensis TaxID=75913 RepID=A0A0K0FDF1_STRVS